jgi:hypothetical protein
MRNEPTTYFERASAEADENRGGRFAALAQARVVGAKPAPTYPAGPQWSHDPTGPEPALGYDVDAIEPIGTAAEVERSLDDHSAPVGNAPPTSSRAAEGESDASRRP